MNTSSFAFYSESLNVVKRASPCCVRGSSIFYSEKIYIDKKNSLVEGEAKLTLYAKLLHEEARQLLHMLGGGGPRAGQRGG